MPHVLCSTTIGPGVDAALGREFTDVVFRVLGDARGWRKYGYTFQQVAAPRSGHDALNIRLETSATAAALCGIPGFSCARIDANDIVISLGNWMGGSKSDLSRDRYRTYVVNHEVGHILGLQHQQCPIEECRRRGLDSCPASVMQQMTRGPDAIAPCVESDWPLDPSWQIDDPRALEFAVRSPFRGILFAVIAVIVLLVVCLMGILTEKIGPQLRGGSPYS
jgi:hypothetical protein